MTAYSHPGCVSKPPRWRSRLAVCLAGAAVAAGTAAAPGWAASATWAGRATTVAVGAAPGANPACTQYYSWGGPCT